MICITTVQEVDGDCFPETLCMH